MVGWADVRVRACDDDDDDDGSDMCVSAGGLTPQLAGALACRLQRGEGLAVTLHIYYANGWGVAADREEAIRWYRLAAAGRSSKAAAQKAATV
jgi:hypothetical protein